MDCSTVEPLLEEYFEGALRERRAAQVARHLAGCSNCAAGLRQIERVAAALEAVPSAAPSEGLLRSISRRAAELPVPGTRRFAGWRWVAAVAAISMAGLALASSLLPLLISEGLASNFPLARWAEDGAVVLRSWFAAAPDVIAALWREAADLSQGCRVAALAVAPALGLWAAAEIGILAALVFVLQAGRRKRPARQMLLV